MILPAQEERFLSASLNYFLIIILHLEIAQTHTCKHIKIVPPLEANNLDYFVKKKIK